MLSEREAALQVRIADMAKEIETLRAENHRLATMMPKIDGFEALVREERARQDAKFGIQKHDIRDWLMILSEEVGELNRAVLERKFPVARVTTIDDVRVRSGVAEREELIQIAAVCKAIWECADRTGRETL